MYDLIYGICLSLIDNREQISGKGNGNRSDVDECGQ